MPGDDVLRLAVAVGSVHLPRMHFVVAQASVMQRVDARLFTVAAANKELTTLPVTQNAQRFALPYNVRRRTYPISDFMVGRALRRWRPEVINLHFLALGGFAAAAAVRGAVPLVTTVHAVEPFLVARPRTTRQQLLKRDCERALAESAMFLAVSDHIADWLGYVGVEPERIHTQYSGIDVDFWSSTLHAEEKLRAQRIVFIGHLTELKGIKELMAASSSLLHKTPHTFEIVGDGPLRDDVVRDAANAPHMTVRGLLQRDQIRELLDRTTVLVLPTRPVGGVTEAAGTVLLEAQSMGVPVITYAVGGTPEMVANEGALVEQGNVDALIEAIDRTLNLTLDEFASESEAVRDWVLNHRSLRECAAGSRRSMELAAQP